MLERAMREAVIVSGGNVNGNVMNHTTPSALDCDAPEVQSVEYPSGIFFPLAL
jgi:hypothetical protein